MKITAISPQIKSKDRVSVFIDGKYNFSLDVFQVVDLEIKVGIEIDDAKLANLKEESQFGKLYSRALEYCLVRPRSGKDVKDYLYRKSLNSIKKSGEIKPGLPKTLTKRVFERLQQKGHIDDAKFAKYWAENRFVKKGISQKRLKNELLNKGIEVSIIEFVVEENDRSDTDEIKKIINKKRSRYDDQKMIAYLLRQGFYFDDIRLVMQDYAD